MVWDLLLYLLMVLGVVILGVLVIFYSHPKLILSAGLRYLMFASGMQIKFIGTENFVFCYGERGQRRKDKSTIFFIHGYTGSKEDWISLFKSLPKDIHLIALDLPGHGASSSPEDDAVSFKGIIDLVHQFVTLVELDHAPFHLVGMSLGGAIAGLYAAEYPELVERLSLICPAMKTPVENDFAREIKRAVDVGVENVNVSHCSLLPQTTEQMQKMFDSCFYYKRSFHKQILKGLVDLRTPKNDIFVRIYRMIVNPENASVLQNKLPLLTMPTHIIWGQDDELLHVSGTEILKKELPNCQQVDIIERCGHSINVDQPGSLIKSICIFRGELEYSDKKET